MTKYPYPYREGTSETARRRRGVIGTVHKGLDRHVRIVDLGAVL